MTHFAFLLLGGAQKGAELQLNNPGEYRLGASLDSDIYLPSYSLNDHEFTLSITNSTITLTIADCSEPTLFVNEQAIDVPPKLQIKIKPFDIICCGALEFCLNITGQKAPRDLQARLDEYKKARAQKIKAEREEKEALQAEEELLHLESIPKDADISLNLPEEVNAMLDVMETQASSTDELEERALAKQKSWQTVLEFTKSNKHIIVSLLIFIILAYQGIALISSSGKAENQTSHQETNLKKIEAYLAKQNLSQLKVKEVKNELPLIEGYVKNKAEKERILQEIYNEKIDAELKVKLTQDQINSVISLFDTYNIKNIKIEEADMMGSFLVSGYATNVSQWDKVKNYLSRDFPDIKNLINEVETPLTRTALLESMLKEQRLLEDVKIKLENDKINVTTFLLPTDNNTWQSIIDDYNQKTGGIPAIVSMQADISWLNIMSLHVGNPSYIVLKDGKKYLEGTIIYGSTKLEKITENSLIFETQRGRAVYTLSKDNM